MSLEADDTDSDSNLLSLLNWNVFSIHIHEYYCPACVEVHYRSKSHVWKQELKENSTTVHVDIQSMLMVTEESWSNKFLSLCYNNKES